MNNIAKFEDFYRTTTPMENIQAPTSDPDINGPTIMDVIPEEN